MKRTLAFLLVVSTIFCLDSYAQSMDTPERKLYYLQRTENQIFELPFEMDHIRNVIYPEILKERRTLAPNYPSEFSLDRDPQIRKDTFLAWINQYPQEFDDYYAYLATYVRTNMNNN